MTPLTALDTAEANEQLTQPPGNGEQETRLLGRARALGDHHFLFMLQCSSFGDAQ